MNGLLFKIKHTWWQFKSAELTAPELALLLLNKIVTLEEKLFLKTKGLFLAGDKNVVYGLNRHLPKSIAKPKRALISYVTEAFSRKHTIGNIKYYFSNYGTVLGLVQALNELGYVVDVIDCNHKNYKPKQAYDLIIYQSFFNFDCIQRCASPGTTLVFFDAVAYWREALLKLEERYKDLNRRKGMNFLGLDIQNYRKLYRRAEEIDGIIKAADVVLLIGDQLARSYDIFGNVYKVINGCFPDTKYVKDLSPENLEKSRQNFLFFAGSLDNVRKGLDLLLDSFIGTDKHLYICSEVSPKLISVYRLHKQPNIHLEGYVKQGTRKFYSLIETCDFVIHPSCAEGVPGGVLDTMRYGLIPIVSKECNIVNASNFGIMLKDYSLESVKEAVDFASTRPIAWLLERARLSASEVRKNYSPEKYTRQVKTVLEDILRMT